nr:molybdenum cofactor biosynthesis protein MoaE [Candidatus Njordarchaeota archaeon]
MKPAGVYKKGELSFDDILRSLKENSSFEAVGAIGIFIGVVREKSPEGHEVTKLEIEAYEEKADTALSTICAEMKKKEGIADVRIYHNLGEFAPGDDLIYVVVAGGHRNDVFEALREAVERYKHEAPIFKKEHLIIRETGKRVTRWVEETSLK